MGRRRLSIVVAAMAIVAAGTGVAVAGDGGKGPLDNPDENLSFAERDQKYRDGSASFERQYAAWFTSPQSVVDPRTVPRSEIMAFQVGGATTFAAAVDRAALAVSGRVIDVRFEPYRTITAFRVDRHAIGDVGEVLTFLQGGYLWPGRDFIGAHLAELSGAPLLLTGDRAVLLLDRSTEGDLSIQGFSGWYRIENGKATSVKGNKFRGADGLTANQLMDRIQARAGP